MSVADDYLALANSSAARPRPIIAGDGSLGDAKQQSKTRQRSDYRCAYKQQILTELLRRREMHSGGRRNKAWLTDFVHEKWPYTKKDHPAFSRRRQFCYNLVFITSKRGQQVPEESGQGESHCGQGQKRTYEDSFKNLPPGPLVVGRKLVVEFKQQAEVHASSRRNANATLEVGAM